MLEHHVRAASEERRAQHPDQEPADARRPPGVLGLGAEQPAFLGGEHACRQELPEHRGQRAAAGHEPPFQRAVVLGASLALIMAMGRAFRESMQAAPITMSKLAVPCVNPTGRLKCLDFSIALIH